VLSQASRAVIPFTTFFATLSITGLRDTGPRLGPVMAAALAPNVRLAARKRVMAASSAFTLRPVRPASASSSGSK